MTAAAAAAAAAAVGGGMQLRRDSVVDVVGGELIGEQMSCGDKDSMLSNPLSLSSLEEGRGVGGRGNFGAAAAATAAPGDGNVE